MSALLRAFQEAAEATADAPVTYDTQEIATLLASFYARGQKAYPKLAVAEAPFGQCVARAVAGGAARHPDALPAEDLYLSCACADGVRGAADTFERRYARIIHRATARVLADRDDREDAEQRVRQQILVGSHDRGPRIAEYRGEGPLEAWISVAAIRIAISLGRAEKAVRRLQAKALAEVSSGDPERLYMKEELRPVVEAAVNTALERLPPRDRLILGLYLVSGLTLQAIGKSLGVSHQAVSKQIAKARDAVLESVGATVAERLKMSASDLSSIMRLVASQLNANISRLLAKP
jgi:RNA polymerase sigma-70 factor (ECF subfamily)